MLTSDNKNEQLEGVNATNAAASAFSCDVLHFKVKFCGTSTTSGGFMLNANF
jgi:hypothetical protein